MNLRKNDGKVDLERIQFFDRLAWMDAANMERYFTSVYDAVEANGCDMLRIEQRFLGPELFEERQRLVTMIRRTGADDSADPVGDQKGSGIYSRSAVDPLLLYLMELADSCKDFGVPPKGTTPDQARVAYVEWSLRKDPETPVRLPIGTTNEYEDARQMSVMDVAYKNRFMKFMFGTRRFLFGDEYVENPVFDQDFTKGGATIKNGQSIDSAFQVTPACRDCVAVDLWLFPEPDIKRKEVWLSQLSDICREIRTFFWKKRGSTFLCDTPSYLMKVLLNLRVCARAFSQKYNVKYKDTRRVAQSAGLADVIQQLNERVAVEWATVACDATMLDAADHGVLDGTLDTRATGQVFHASSVATVRLMGVATEQSGDAAEDDDSEDDEPGLTYKCSYAVTCAREGVDVVKHDVDARSVDWSTSSCGALIAGQIDLPFYTIGSAANFALKRAGDWGMVEHCAKFDHVFVTSDKLAALYARMKGVCVLYLNDHRNVKTVKVDGIDRDMIQYTISMCGSFEERAHLQPVDSPVFAKIGPVPARISAQSAGSASLNYAIAASCAAIVVAASMC